MVGDLGNVPSQLTEFPVRVVLKGSVAAGSETLHEEFNTLVLSAENNQTGIALTAPKGTELILVGDYLRYHT